jgi:hypothetical protein
MADHRPPTAADQSAASTGALELALMRHARQKRILMRRTPDLTHSSVEIDPRFVVQVQRVTMVTVPSNPDCHISH